MRFRDRTQAGQRLAASLAEENFGPSIVYALPRGGVVLGVEVARVLECPLELIIARKIGHPTNPEYAIGAVTEHAEPVWNAAEVAALDPDWLEQSVEQERAEAKRRQRRYLTGRSSLSCQGKTAIIVDDGIATGLTMLAAIRAVRQRQPRQIVVAVPVMPSDTFKQLRSETDRIVALDIPSQYMGAVGAYYDEFEQVSDKEVIRIINLTWMPEPV